MAQIPTPGMEKYYAPKEQPVFLLDCQAAFEKLTSQEKLYAHYMSVASWYGSLICLHQTSIESPAIFIMLQKLFHAQNIDDLAQASQKNGVNQEAFNNFVQYATTFYELQEILIISQPRCSESEFQKILESSSAPQETKNSILLLFNEYKGKIFSLDPAQLELAMPGKGITTYYSPNITSSDVAIVRQFMTEQNISPYNTRLFKTGEKEFELKLASSQKKPSSTHKFQGTNIVRTKSHLKDATIHTAYGDHSAYLTKVTENLQKAKEYAANDKQANMLTKYVDSFSGGSIDDHKDSQRWWIQDIGPAVETNIGFIESYRDPEGERGEFEGFVAVVNKEMSKKFANLVTNAEQFIAQLPWPKEFEKDKFLKPDFTSLEVLTYASSGVPAGINIPNYDDIRQTQGFKNVSLGNVIAAKSKEKIDFILDEDQMYFEQYDIKSFEVQVGIHELLGHGTGKLLMEDEQGHKNFDSNLINPITNAPVASWYKPKETYDSLFQSYGSTVEECRAESCGLYLCSNPDLLKQFGITDPKEQGDVYYANWLGMILKGFKGLEFYTPATQKWGQAHSQARYVILRVLLEAGEGLVTIKQANDTVYLVLDRSKILTVGQKAIGAFLKKLQIYKATADVQGAIAFYGEYSKVPEDMLNYRDIVLSKQKPRKVFVQAHTYIENGEVKQKVFEASPKGVIESMVARFGPNDVQQYY